MPAAPGLWSQWTAWLARAGVPLTAAAGVRLALEPGRGRTAAPVRNALAGTVAVRARRDRGSYLRREPFASG